MVIYKYTSKKQEITIDELNQCCSNYKTMWNAPNCTAILPIFDKYFGDFKSRRLSEICAVSNKHFKRIVWLFFEKKPKNPPKGSS